MDNQAPFTCWPRKQPAGVAGRLHPHASMVMVMTPVMVVVMMVAPVVMVIEMAPMMVMMPPVVVMTAMMMVMVLRFLSEPRFRIDRLSREGRGLRREGRGRQGKGAADDQRKDIAFHDSSLRVPQPLNALLCPRFIHACEPGLNTLALGSPQKWPGARAAGRVFGAQNEPPASFRRARLSAERHDLRLRRCQGSSRCFRLRCCDHHRAGRAHDGAAQASCERELHAARAASPSPPALPPRVPRRLVCSSPRIERGAGFGSPLCICQCRPWSTRVARQSARSVCSVTWEI